jgi:V/A-type H+/Na+-transporting ATPase subunit K
MKRLVPLFVAMWVLAMPMVAVAAAGGEEGDIEKPAAREPLSADNRATIAAFVACGVAFITAISILGAAYAVAHVGSAAIGAASEKPEMMGRSLIFVALGEGLAVLGLAVAFVMMFMILTELIK